MGKAANDDCRRLVREGLEVAGSPRFDFQGCGCADYKFTRIVTGKGSPAARLPCNWCDVTKFELLESLRPH